MSLILAIDTSGPACAVALLDSAQQRVLHARSDDIGRGHAEHLFSMIDDALSQCRCAFEDIARISVLRGPGSFTGLRVGIAAARGLALALDVPCIGIDAFAAFHHAVDHAQPLAIALDARRGQVWIAEFDADGDLIVAPTAFDLKDAELGKWPFKTSRICGSGAAVLLERAAMDIGLPLLGEAAQPPVETIAMLAARAEPNAHPPVPLYLRAADAKPAAPSPVRRVAAP